MRIPEKRVIIAAGVGAVGALVFGGLIAVTVIGSGILDMSAVGKPDPLESTVGPWMLHASRRHRTSGERNPFADDASAASAGLEHYRANCLPCHGAPEVKAAEFAAGLHPSAPHLTIPRIKQLSDSELFWTVKNGVKMTGMPGFTNSHDDDEVWHIVAAVRALSHLTPEQSAVLATPQDGGRHHHGQTADRASGADTPSPDAQDHEHGSASRPDHEAQSPEAATGDATHDHGDHHPSTSAPDPSKQGPPSEHGATDATGIPSSPVPPFRSTEPEVTTPAR